MGNLNGVGVVGAYRSGRLWGRGGWSRGPGHAGPGGAAAGCSGFSPVSSGEPQGGGDLGRSVPQEGHLWPPVE